MRYVTFYNSLYSLEVHRWIRKKTTQLLTELEILTRLFVEVNSQNTDSWQLGPKFGLFVLVSLATSTVYVRKSTFGHAIKPFGTCLAVKPLTLCVLDLNLEKRPLAGAPARVKTQQNNIATKKKAPLAHRLDHLSTQVLIYDGLVDVPVGLFCVGTGEGDIREEMKRRKWRNE